MCYFELPCQKCNSIVPFLPFPDVALDFKIIWHRQKMTVYFEYLSLCPHQPQIFGCSSHAIECMNNYCYHLKHKTKTWTFNTCPCWLYTNYKGWVGFMCLFPSQRVMISLKCSRYWHFTQSCWFESYQVKSIRNNLNIVNLTTFNVVCSAMGDLSCIFLETNLELVIF